MCSVWVGVDGLGRFLLLEYFVLEVVWLPLLSGQWWTYPPAVVVDDSSHPIPKGDNLHYHLGRGEESHGWDFR